MIFKSALSYSAVMIFRQWEWTEIMTAACGMADRKTIDGIFFRILIYCTERDMISNHDWQYIREKKQ